MGIGLIALRRVSGIHGTGWPAVWDLAATGGGEIPFGSVGASNHRFSSTTTPLLPPLLRVNLISSIRIPGSIALAMS